MVLMSAAAYTALTSLSLLALFNSLLRLQLRDGSVGIVSTKWLFCSPAATFTIQSLSWLYMYCCLLSSKLWGPRLKRVMEYWGYSSIWA